MSANPSFQYPKLTIPSVRYPASFNEFAVHGTFDSYRTKLVRAKEEFADVYSSVKERVEVSLK